MKLLIVTQKVDATDPVLGFFHGWIKEFSDHCEKVTVICLYKGAYELPAHVHVFSLGKEGNKSKMYYIFTFLKLIYKHRNEYDSVFVHMNQIYVILGALIWKMLKKKISLWYTHKNVTLSLKVAVQLADVIFTASKESFRIQSNKVKIVGHGINTKKFSNIIQEKNKNHFSIVSVGRISPSKGYDYILDAVEFVEPHIPNIVCNIWGSVAMLNENTYLNNLKEYARSRDLKINFKGPVLHDKLNEILQTSDVFVNMSTTGSLDKAVLEAMVAGVIVVTSNEAFKDILSKYPHLYIQRDGQSLAYSLEKIYNLSEEERKEIIEYYRDYVLKNHSLELLIPNLVSALS